jgi:hypothetical protein
VSVGEFEDMVMSENSSEIKEYVNDQIMFLDAGGRAFGLGYRYSQRDGFQLGMKRSLI